MAGARRKYKILVCRGPECGDKRRSADIHAAFKQVLESCPLDGSEATLEQYSCFGKCQRGPNVLVREVVPGENAFLVSMMPTAGVGAFLYHGVKPDEARRIVEEHVKNGRPLLDLVTRGAPPLAASAGKK